MPDAKYTADDVDSLAADFEKKAERVQANKGSQVKLRAAERDLLVAAEKARDLLNIAVKGDKDLLRDVFGGPGISRFHRLRNTMEACGELSDMHKNDQRWAGLHAAMDTIEEVLKQYGFFKLWDLSKPPDQVSYPGIKAKGQLFSPGETLKLVVDAGEGGEPTSFTIDTALPEGLELNPATGEITGTIPADVEVPERSYTITAGNKKGDCVFKIKFGVQEPKPDGIKYDGLEDSCAGDFVEVKPTIEGGKPKTWTVSPELPPGLSLDQATGVISGACEKVAEKKEYTVTASNKSGSASVAFNFGVAESPPESICYPGLKDEYPHAAVMHLLPDVHFRGMSSAEGKPRITINWEKAKAVVTSMRKTMPTEVKMLLNNLEYSITPALPEGLQLIERTGVITGKPMKPMGPQEYEVTTKNVSGSASTTIKFAIRLQPPDELSFPSADGTFYVGSPMSLSPEVEGLVEEWTVSTPLPAGLELDHVSGIISGVPQEEASGKTWTVSAKNAEGAATVDLTFTVMRAAPKNLSYPDAQDTYALDKPMSDLCPVFEGTINEFAVSPALPPGLSLDKGTGVISGTPTKATDPQEYVITGSNESGKTEKAVKFGVKLMPPEDLRYPSIDDIYNVDEDVRLVPEVDGQANNWTLESAFPAGLALDPTTGVISGAPTETAEEASYTITASNEAGGTSAVVTFMVTAPEPSGLRYPAADGYEVGVPMTIEPEIDSGICAKYTVSPPLPEGLQIDEKTGVISGSPAQKTDKREYEVTATNIAGSTSTKLVFECISSLTPEQMAEEEMMKFAMLLEGITDLADMPPEPSKMESKWCWMLWMVHRAHLNDPTLDVLNFANMAMPLPQVEPRVAPKLMKALAHNTHLTQLELANTGLQKMQGPELAESLMKNTKLRVVNIETNCLDADSMLPIVHALKASAESSVLETLKISSQISAQVLGRPFEEAMADMLSVNQRITKLGYACQDPNYRNKIDRCILKNADAARQRRKKTPIGGDAGPPAIEKAMTKVTFVLAPQKARWESFPDDNAPLKVACLHVANEKGIADPRQFKSKLQAFARSKGVNLKFSEVAPLIKDFNTKFFAAFQGVQVQITDDKNVVTNGTLRDCTEKNDRWTLDVWKDTTAMIKFTSASSPKVEIYDSVVEWLKPLDL
mmetsp:Transcript_28753/g.79189  ORF Transcript_28753/g.79189 Transcript_28753/m.79189 type:complete len:1154 (-) Transcript_28753:131-3592(-)